MPLMRGKSDKVVGRNIAELVRAGHPRRQAIAIALDEAGVDRKFGEKTAGGRRSSPAPRMPQRRVS